MKTLPADETTEYASRDQGDVPSPFKKEREQGKRLLSDAQADRSFALIPSAGKSVAGSTTYLFLRPFQALGTVVSISCALILLTAKPRAADLPTAQNNFRIDLSPHPFAGALLSDSPFGINNALRPDMPDLEARLGAMQHAGIKWGRQDFTWSRIEIKKGEYNFEPYDQLVEQCRKHGLLIFGNLTRNPPFYDMRTPEAVEAYCAFA